jgi:poly(A) polymerase
MARSRTLRLSNPYMPFDVPTATPVMTSLRVIAREQHGISRRNISPNALRVLYRLKEAGFSAHLVGGAVRDLLLGGHPKDFDVATDATPEQVKRLFRNCRLIGRRFRLAHVLFGPEIVEVATFRAGSDDGSGDRHVVDGRIVRDNVYGTIEDDAVRRDFTANALYYAIDDFSVRDFVGGFDDVAARRLRLIGDPEQRYREDPVRMLRAVRLAAKLGFDIEPGAWHAIARLAPLIAEAAPARLFEELLKLFLGGHAADSFALLSRCGLLRELLPMTAVAVEESPADARFVQQALASTDARVREEKTVTPVFLFAALLWPALQAELRVESAADAEPAQHLARVAQRLLQAQIRRVALPKRITLPMLELWSLQPRFAQRTRKRAARLLAHPRFRAAYDFVLLRAAQEPELAETAQWWAAAQGAGGIDAAPVVREAAASKSADEPAAPARRRRRRRRGRRGGAKPGTESSDG